MRETAARIVSQNKHLWRTTVIGTFLMGLEQSTNYRPIKTCFFSRDRDQQKSISASSELHSKSLPVVHFTNEIRLSSAQEHITVLACTGTNIPHGAPGGVQAKMTTPSAIMQCHFKFYEDG